jgi:hypothetical protein
LFENVVYNTKDFLSEHPGGAPKIAEYFGKRIDDAFEEENHSKNARRLMKTLPIVGYYNALKEEKLEESDEEDTENTLGRFCCSARHCIKKIVTKEDPVYLHKTLGFLVLASFFYRYAIVLPRQGNLGMDGSWFDYLNVTLHVALSCSSLIFVVIKKRIKTQLLIIWEEYRLHTIVFTLRCCTVSYMGFMWAYEPTDFRHFVQFLIVMAHHLVVDEITRRVGPEDPTETTVRINSVPVGLRATLRRRFYSFA